MEWTADKTKLSHKRGREIKRVAHATEAVAAMPLIVVAVDVHITLTVVPPIERGEFVREVVCVITP